ncbi:MAG: complex subunit Pcc1 [Methanolobus sp.]|jgi:KEOPS complex subunit Pcc1|nr:complex subunit Pcc1 [Methanolobus sp.]MDK2833337.1 complex subunit Pcc1 [Methanolobus sp.]MDK2911251.1 complex subunit Pcc1 [Methanolobus sp.]
MESVFETVHADAVLRSLEPEIETPVTERSRMEVRADGSSLHLVITADDIISMRSSLNTWLRLVQVACEVASLKEELAN